MKESITTTNMQSTIEIYNHSHEYGDIVIACPVYISKGIHEKENQSVLKHVCALLNSGGGILVMENLDFNQGTQSKSLDEWWSGMESNFTTILSGDDICNYLDFVGNFDDPHLYLFVKSAEHLCTINYHCRLPTDTATHSVTYSSAVKLCSRTGPNQGLSSLPTIPSTFVYGKTEETLKQEGKQIQFKHLSSTTKNNTKALPDKVVYYSSKYISAFANHEGGHIYFGIEDTSASVLGEQMTEADEHRICHQMQNKMNSIIWRDTAFVSEKGIHWDIKFIPVSQSPRDQIRKVIVVSVCKMHGGVFTNEPESYVVTSQLDGHKYNYSSCRLQFDEWKSELLNQSRDISSLRTRFIRLPMMTPQSRLVYSLPHTLISSREKVVKLSASFNLHPRSTLHAIRNISVREGLKEVCEELVGEDHIALCLDYTWSLDLDMSSKPNTIAANVALFCARRGLHLVCLAASLTPFKEEWSFVSKLAVNLKKVLVQHGGCNKHLGFRCHVIDLSSVTSLGMWKEAFCKEIYPPTFSVTEESMAAILDALTISTSSYRPLSTYCSSNETDHYFMLTSDQMELLWTNQLTKELWVHGPPGSGKTIAAMETIRMLRHRGCERNEVLYVAENLLLCSYVRSFDLALVVHRRELLSDADDLSVFNKKYGCVRNVIVDEAQNFKDRDGDWYSILEKLSQKINKDQTDLCSGYFWVFMDYAQKVHKFNAGLPNIIGKNNFMLREISRNSQEIYTYAKKFMGHQSEDTCDSFPGVSSSSGHLGHDYFSGNEVKVVKCDKTSLEATLAHILRNCRGQEGLSSEDMVVLTSKKNEVSEIKDNILPKSHVASEKSKAVSEPVTSAVESPGPCSENVDMKEEDMDTKPSNQAIVASDMASDSPVLVSTVREFSGLDRPVVIGVDPHINQNHADLDKFLLNLVTRARDQLIILTTSDELMKKLKVSS